VVDSRGIKKRGGVWNSLYTSPVRGGGGELSVCSKQTGKEDKDPATSGKGNQGKR